MDRDPGLQAMQEIIERMMQEGASQEDIDAALMEFAYRHQQERKNAADDLTGLPEDVSAETCYLHACKLFEAFRDDEAAACLRRTLELQPDHYDAKRMLLQMEENDEVLYRKLTELETEVEARWKAERQTLAAPKAASSDPAAIAAQAEAASEPSGLGATASATPAPFAPGSAWEIPLGRTLLQIKGDRAFLSYDLGRYRAAREACEQALALDAADRQNLRGLLIMLYAYFEDDTAARELVARYDNEETSWFLLGMAVLAYKQGNLVEARSSFDRFLALYPDLLVEFSLFLAGSPEPPARQPSARDKDRNDVYSALEDAVAVVDSTPGFLSWVTVEYADRLFAD